MAGNGPNPEHRQGQVNWKEAGRDRGIIINEGNRPNSTQDTRCFRCLDYGHHQANCTKEPVCYKCKDKGHMAIDCKSADSRKVRMFGFGIPGQGFYSLNFPEAKIKTHQATGMLTILKGDADEGKIDKELKNLIRADWDFRVKQTHI